MGRRCSVHEEPVHQRLSRAREARGETIAALSRRICVAERLLEAIDAGRFADLPTGIYARTAVRRYATAFGLDPDEILGVCGSSLPVPEDPVSALARLRGLTPASPPRPSRPLAPHGEPAGPAPLPAWRPLAAVAIDGLVVAALLVAAIAGTIPLSGTRAASLGYAAAPVFGLLGCLLGSCYFVFFGGIACATAGERAIGMRVGRRHPRRVDPPMVVARAVRCAARDVRYIVRLGAWAAPAIWPASGGQHREPSIGHAGGQ